MLYQYICSISTLCDTMCVNSLLFPPPSETLRTNLTTPAFIHPAYAYIYIANIAYYCKPTTTYCQQATRPILLVSPPFPDRTAPNTYLFDSLSQPAWRCVLSRTANCLLSLVNFLFFSYLDFNMQNDTNK